MIKLGSSKILGLSLWPDGALAAQVAIEGGTAQIARTAEFIAPAGITLDKPAEFGRALHSFLRMQGISAKTAVIGLPARMLMSRKKDIPPATLQNTIMSLQLVAETEFASEASRLVVDFTGTPSTSTHSSVMLFATEQNILAQVQAMADSAGLRLEALTSTSAAQLAAASTGAGHDDLIVTIYRSGAEALIGRNANPSQVRHIPMGGDGDESVDRLAGEIRRMMIAAQNIDTAPALSVWGGSKMTGAALGARLNMAPAPARLAHMTAELTQEQNQFAPAVALALTMLNPHGPPVNFLKSRLAVKARTSHRRQITWAAVVGVMLIAAVTYGIVDYQQKTNLLDSLKKRITANNVAAKNAQAAVDRLTLVRGWVNQNPLCLAALRDLTTYFPEDATIYATSFSYKTEKVVITAAKKNADQPESTILTIQITGKANSEQQVLALLDKLKDNRRFYDPKVQEIRTATRGNRQVTFSLTCTYRGKES